MVKLIEMKATRRGYFIGEKLKKLLQEKGLSIYRLAKLTGLTQSGLSMIINNQRAVSPAILRKIAETLNIPEVYFIEEEPTKEYPPSPEVIEREYIAIPIITGVGAGGEVITDDYTLIKRTQLPKKTVSAFEVEGDSMEPTIPKDWLVLVDPTDLQLYEGGIFLFASQGNGLFIRRVHKVDNQWELVPDNRKYAPQKLTEEIKVLGRVLKKLPKIEPMEVE
ncbi:putative phage repressor [Hydrogenobacter thermophilus TK-6]|uniref:Putative phage repressor n=1 Tax=Hydrogenobacter thermophilus (strain DSM 6534 / IAM 12695 / TK-6) TaxID=608538 RepID=D3DGN7_HYDTT|nr:XRE family transcriptional regulator [Hydrogenobacter thermophilus]ADO44923.1 putative phage repressor [Hydrogenobacter thermophilus TK-6]BAI68989.1 putative phage repressor [Hydrogenobacter thermophilus TK-6]